MTGAPPRTRTGQSLLVLAGLALAGASAVVLSPAGDRFTADLLDKPIVQSLDRPIRAALMDAGFRLHADPQGRFSVGIPPGYEPDLATGDSWRFAGPVLGGLPTYVVLTVGPERDDLPALGALRDRRVGKDSNLPYTLVASDPGELDGRPALNRAFMLGGYRGWEVVSRTERGWVCLTFLCREDRFFEHEVDFRKMLASYRLGSAPAAAP